jgi:hypothetical protein
VRPRRRRHEKTKHREQGQNVAPHGGDPQDRAQASDFNGATLANGRACLGEANRLAQVCCFAPSSPRCSTGLLGPRHSEPPPPSGSASWPSVVRTSGNSTGWQPTVRPPPSSSATSATTWPSKDARQELLHDCGDLLSRCCPGVDGLSTSRTAVARTPASRWSRRPDPQLPCGSWRLGRVVRHRSAKPGTPVRLR